MRIEAIARRREWRELLARHPAAPLQQDWAYGEAVAAAGQETRRFVLKSDDGVPLALAQTAERRLIGRFGMAVLMRGPLWLEGATKPCQEGGLLEVLRRRLRGRGIMWTPEDGDANRRRCGHRRVMTGYSTLFLDLAQPLAAIRKGLDGKWRNALVCAERATPSLKIVHRGALLEWLIDANEAHRQRAGYRGPSPGFIRNLCQAAGPRRVTALIACKGHDPIAGILMIRHGTAATYLAGCTSEAGRSCNAHHLLLWRAMARLGDEGVRVLDLGGLETLTAPGIARFKLGTGGQLITLAGTYLIPPYLGSGRDPQ